MDAPPPSSEEEPPSFQPARHAAYFKRCLALLPRAYTSADTSRITLAYFALSGLDLLGHLDEAVSLEARREHIEWIYSLQVRPSDAEGDDRRYRRCGFRGSTAFGHKPRPPGVASAHAQDVAHIAMTYTAMLCLLVLGDDLSRVDRTAVVRALKFLQQRDGSFSPICDGGESDLRFLYCACVISHLLNDWSGVDCGKATQYIRSCFTYDHGLSQAPGQESHGGSTYCGIAALALIGNIRTTLPVEKVTLWLLRRQRSGFNGRVNKPDDTCYSFWIGGALEILREFDGVDKEANTRFLMSTQTKWGGFGKWAGATPDLLHSYMGVAGISLMGNREVRAMDPVLNISRRVSLSLPTANVWWKDGVKGTRPRET